MYMNNNRIKRKKYFKRKNFYYIQKLNKVDCYGKEKEVSDIGGNLLFISFECWP